MPVVARARASGTHARADKTHRPSALTPRTTNVRAWSGNALYLPDRTAVASSIRRTRCASSNVSRLTPTVGVRPSERASARATLPTLNCSTHLTKVSIRLAAADQVRRPDDSSRRHRSLSCPRLGCPLWLRTGHSRAIDLMMGTCRRASGRPAAALAAGELELPTLCRPSPTEEAGGQSSVILFLTMTGIQRSSSSRMNAAKASGEPPMTSIIWARSAWITSGSWSTAVISL